MLAENVLFGTRNPIEALILMLINDGDQEFRKMRDNLLDPAHRNFAMSVGNHKNQHGMVTAMLCLEYVDKYTVK